VEELKNRLTCFRDTHESCLLGKKEVIGIDEKNNGKGQEKLGTSDTPVDKAQAQYQGSEPDKKRNDILYFPIHRLIHILSALSIV
jgi:hypothetical protein